MANRVSTCDAHDESACEACQETARIWGDPWDTALRRLLDEEGPS